MTKLTDLETSILKRKKLIILIALPLMFLMGCAAMRAFTSILTGGAGDGGSDGSGGASDFSFWVNTLDYFAQSPLATLAAGSVPGGGLALFALRAALGAGKQLNAVMDGVDAGDDEETRERISEHATDVGVQHKLRERLKKRREKSGREPHRKKSGLKRKRHKKVTPMKIYSISKAKTSRENRKKRKKS